MKPLCYILIIYIFGLLSYPCQDCGMHDGTQQKCPTEKHDTGHKDCHGCSPFCVCNCCHGNTLLVFNTLITDVKSVPSPVLTAYKELSAKEVYIDIWDPPKI